MGEYGEEDIGKKGSGTGKKNAIIAFVVIACVAMAAYIIGAENSEFSKLPSRTGSTSGFFGLVGIGGNSGSMEDDNSSIAEFKNSVLNAEVQLKDLNLEVSSTQVFLDGKASIETPGNSQTLKSRAELVGFEGIIELNNESAKALGDLKAVNTECCEHVFTVEKTAEIVSESIVLENAKIARIEAMVQGVLEIESRNGKSRIEFLKASSVVLENFEGRIEYSKGKALIQGKTEVLRIKEQ